jgi:hypothetical protein
MRHEMRLTRLECVLYEANHYPPPGGVEFYSSVNYRERRPASLRDVKIIQ